MSRAYWVAAVTGTIAAAFVINRLALNTTEAGMIAAVLVNTLFWLALADVFVVKK